MRSVTSTGKICSDSASSRNDCTTDKIPILSHSRARCVTAVNVGQSGPGKKDKCLTVPGGERPQPPYNKSVSSIISAAITFKSVLLSLDFL